MGGALHGGAGHPQLAVDPRFATGPDRVAHREALEARVAERFASLATEEALELLADAGIAAAGVNSVPEFLDHPVLAERDRWRRVEVPGAPAPVRALLPPADLGGVEPRMEPVPAAGAHTRRILASLGRAPEEIARLLAAGVAEADD